MTRRVPLTFAARYREPILDGAKTATVRYGFDEPVSPGDVFDMQTPDGEHFATAHAERTREATALDVAAANLDGHRDYDDVADLLAHLGDFYSDADLTPKTDLTVLWWRAAHEPGSKRFCRACREGFRA